MTTAQRSPRIVDLAPLTKVALDFNGQYTEDAVFIGLHGEGDDREAQFLSVGRTGRTYDWSAYRYNNRWVYGSSGERLRVVAIIA
jgi:hypothetical protein